MLTALEEGVKGGTWFALIDKVYALPNLRAAFAKVKANRGGAGVDHQSIAMFDRELEAHLEKLARQLKDGTYSPQAVRRVWIPKAGKKELRPLGIPTARERVVQAALRSVLEPIFERDFAEHSYGFRPKRGCKDALRRVDRLLKSGYTWVVDADLKGYFDTIPHQRLMDRVKTKIADGKVLRLVEAFLTQGVQDTDGEELHPEAGTPQGGVISPLLSNIYLDPLDREMAENGYEMVRYADDFVTLCRSETEADEALARVRAWAESNGLTLHPEKTRIVPVEPDPKKRLRGHFNFLGYRFWRKWSPSEKSQQKLKDTIRAKTRRQNGRSLGTIIADVNGTLRGWAEYFKHGAKAPFEELDKWIRMRLRSILRKRRKHHGRGRGKDHLRWPNKYFAAEGLLSLKQYRQAACQSSRR
jgi:RNA-directed DNA polymerase